MLSLVAPVLIPLVVAFAIIWAVGLIYNNCRSKH